MEKPLRVKKAFCRQKKPQKLPYFQNSYNFRKKGVIQYITVDTEKCLINAERVVNNSTYLNCSVLLRNVVAVHEGEQICCIYIII